MYNVDIVSNGSWSLMIVKVTSVVSISFFSKLTVTNVPLLFTQSESSYVVNYQVNN